MLGNYGRLARCAGLWCVALPAGCGSEGPGAPSPPAGLLSPKANQPNPASPISGVPLAYMPVHTNLPSAAQYAYYDMGLCGPFAPPVNDPKPRKSFTDATGVCAVFKVPSLRNVAITAPYFHNGNAADLHKALQFYITRDINNIAFLCTLTDGFDPNDPGAYNIPAQCAPQAR